MEARRAISSEIIKSKKKIKDEHRKLDKDMMQRAKNAWNLIKTAYEEYDVNKMQVGCEQLIGQLKSLKELYRGNR